MTMVRLNDAKTTRLTWTTTGVNLSKEQTISVFAQDGTTMAQTGIVASYADSVSSAVLTAFSLKDKSGNTYGGNIVGNTITVEVPYMTTDLTTGPCSPLPPLRPRLWLLILSTPNPALTVLLTMS